MNEHFDVEIVLRDVLEVLRRHNIPIETAALNVSLLDTAFDERIPQLMSYKTGFFHRPMVIDNVHLLFQAQRRYPFDDILQALEREIKPTIQGFAETLQREYPNLKVEFVDTSATQSADLPHALNLYSYRLGVDCRFSDDAHADYNELDLAICLQQREATAYPRLDAWVGWLVDEESGGDWGVDIVFDAIATGQDYAPHHLDLLRQALPSYLQRFREEIIAQFSEEPENAG